MRDTRVEMRTMAHAMDGDSPLDSHRKLMSLLYLRAVSLGRSKGIPEGPSTQCFRFLAPTTIPEGPST